MQKTQKVQCPNCGATSGFKEEKIGYFTCGYCYSHWEQLTILPTQNTDTDSIFVDLIDKLLTEHAKLTPERPKYTERAFSSILGVWNYLAEIKDETTARNIAPKLKDILFQQVAYYESQGVTKHTTQAKLIHTNAEDREYQMHQFLIEYYVLLAKIESKFYAETAHLEKALTYILVAEALHEYPIDDFREEIAACHLGILQRLENESKTFEWLNSLVNFYPMKSITEDLQQKLGYAPEADDITDYKKQITAYKEEVTFRFEELIFSEAYKNWKKQQTIKS